MASNLTPLEQFNCDGDPTSMGVRWEKWKRGLQIYLDAAEIDEPVRKRAILLHTGGLGLQEIYYNIPGAHVDENDDNFDDNEDVYEIALKKLDEYFAPKQSRVFERHIFRLMKQESEEKFEKFLVRLRKQADKCIFKDKEVKEESLIDQIVEKCASVELRRKILKAGDSFTLQDIIAEANALESVKRQLEEFDGKTTPNTVNKISSKVNKPQVLKEYGGKNNKNPCTRCGSFKHMFYDLKCPALKVKCHKCGKTGHFKKRCRTVGFKRTSPQSSDTPGPSKKPKTDTEKVNCIDDKIEYIFHIDDDSVIKCSLGEVEVKLLIDSGSKCNLLTEKTWKRVKNSNIKVFDQVKSPDKVFLPYGSTQPLVVLGSFKTRVKVAGKDEIATFYVIKDGTKDILGKDTSTQMGLLHIGLQVNNVGTFPKFKDVMVEIPIDEQVKPVCQPCRRVPIPLEDKVNKKIDELIQSDIIEEVREPSRWVSPIVPVLKDNGDVRVCVDMRRANAAIVRENHPLPTMDQLLPKFRKAKFFSRIDIKDAFHQIEIHPDSRHITTFITSKGMFRYKRLMFGISCAPEIFQKTLERTLIGCEGTVNFIDDIIVFGANEEEHDRRLQNVLKTLKDNNILLNEGKCVYKTQKIQFLGHELSVEGVRPLDKYLKSIQNFRAPTTVDELQSFLGLVNYVGKWIPNLATLTEPLRQLLRIKVSKGAVISKFWGQEQNSAFEKLKKCLSDIETLGYYDPADKTQVIADASPVGLGAVLIQVDSNGPRIVAYGNKSLTDCEKRYCQTEKEALAIVWAVEHFQIYLYGKEFELISDHKPLEVIFGPHSKPCARIERWVLRLQSFRYKIIYRPGKSNIADPLSRLCVEQYAVNYCSMDYVNQIAQYATPVAVSLHDIETSSAEDAEICKVKNGLYQQIWDPTVNTYKVFETELCFHENILLRGNKIVIPINLRQRVLEAAHEGHPGIVAMKQRLRTKVWWPKIDHDAEKMVKNCRSCTIVSAPNPPIPMKRRELPSEPWVDVSMDLLGPLPSGDYIFVLIDYYSRYKEVKILRTITTAEIIKHLKEIFSRLGFPVSVTADNGRQFSSEELKSYFGECGIKLYSTIPYWPQMNGEVERQNRSILKRLRISQVEKKDWKDDLLRYMMMYNSTPHSTTGKSPSELFYRRQFRDKIPSVVGIDNNITDTETRDKDKIRKETGKEYSDRKRKAVDHCIEEGDKVFVKNFTKDNKLNPNFSPAPHTVIKANKDSGDIQVRNDESGQELRRNVIHLKKIGGEWKVAGKDKLSGDIDKSNGDGDGDFHGQSSVNGS